MQVRDERHSKIDGFEPGDASVDRRRFRAPHDASAKIHQVRRAIHDDRRGQRLTIWVGGRSPGSQEHDLRPIWRRRLLRSDGVRLWKMANTHQHGNRQDCHES